MRALAIGGLEPTGRAGLLADLEAMRAGGVNGIAIASALTAQGTQTFRLQPTAPEVLKAQIAAALELGPVQAVKVGLIPGRAVLKVLLNLQLEVPWVLDPVVKTSRDEPLSLLQPADVRAFARPNVILTPNTVEAAWLLSWSPIHTVAQAALAGRLLLSWGFGGVVVKGGHLAGPKVDLVWSDTGFEALEAAAISRRVGLRRGSGCRFASALAASLAHGESLSVAARQAKTLVQDYLRA